MVDAVGLSGGGPRERRLDRLAVVRVAEGEDLLVGEAFAAEAVQALPLLGDPGDARGHVPLPAPEVREALAPAQQLGRATEPLLRLLELGDVLGVDVHADRLARAVQ